MGGKPALTISSWHWQPAVISLSERAEASLGANSCQSYAEPIFSMKQLLKEVPGDRHLNCLKSQTQSTLNKKRIQGSVGQTSMEATIKQPRGVSLNDLKRPARVTRLLWVTSICCILVLGQRKLHLASDNVQNAQS